MLRYQLEDHTAKHCPYRLIKCTHCELSISLNDGEISGSTRLSDLSVNKCGYDQAHRNECKKMPVECPNGCQEGFTILRETV